MTDVRLSRITGGSAEECICGPVKLEKKLQTLIEKHIEAFLLRPGCRSRTVTERLSGIHILGMGQPGRATWS